MPIKGQQSLHFYHLLRVEKVGTLELYAGIPALQKPHPFQLAHK